MQPLDRAFAPCVPRALLCRGVWWPGKWSWSWGDSIQAGSPWPPWASASVPAHPPPLRPLSWAVAPRAAASRPCCPLPPRRSPRGPACSSCSPAAGVRSWGPGPWLHFLCSFQLTPKPTVSVSPCPAPGISSPHCPLASWPSPAALKQPSRGHSQFRHHVPGLSFSPDVLSRLQAAPGVGACRTPWKLGLLSRPPLSIWAPALLSPAGLSRTFGCGFSAPVCARAAPDLSQLQTHIQTLIRQCPSDAQGAR